MCRNGIFKYNKIEDIAVFKTNNNSPCCLIVKLTKYNLSPDCLPQDKQKHFKFLPKIHCIIKKLEIFFVESLQPFLL